jgi:hypothetical protein
MRRLFILLVFGLSFNALWGQEDTSKSVELEGPTKNSSMPKLNPVFKSKSNPFTYKKEFDLNISAAKKNPVKMLPDNNLVQAGAYFKFDPKIGPKEDKDSKEYFGDMFLGDIKTNAKFVGVVCRDHQIVDGDRVMIYHNGKVVHNNFYLTGGFKGVNIDLEKGFNTIVFQALNQGATGPNTAQVGVYDEKGTLLKEGIWTLSTGSKGTLIVVRE